MAVRLPALSFEFRAAALGLWPRAARRLLRLCSSLFLLDRRPFENLVSFNCWIFLTCAPRPAESIVPSFFSKKGNVSGLQGQGL